MTIATGGDRQSGVTIELYGVPRVRAGRRECIVSATTVAEAVRSLEQQCPELTGSVIIDGCLHSAYRLSLNGERFISDPTTPLVAGDALVLVAADAGG